MTLYECYECEQYESTVTEIVEGSGEFVRFLPQLYSAIRLPIVEFESSTKGKNNQTIKHIRHQVLVFSEHLQIKKIVLLCNLPFEICRIIWTYLIL